MSLDKIIALTDTLSRVEENLKEEMAILEFVLDSITDGYWDWNIQTNYEYFSNKFKSQLGYKRMKPTPESWQNICNKEDLAEAYIRVEAHFKGETEEFKQILRLRHKDGHEVKVICRGKVIKWDADGKPLRMIGTHQLVTNE
jgi:PAS domain S-box-containing protein